MTPDELDRLSSLLTYTPTPDDLVAASNALLKHAALLRAFDVLLVDVSRIAEDDASVLWKQDRDTVYEAWHALRKQAESAVNKARVALDAAEGDH